MSEQLAPASFIAEVLANEPKVVDAFLPEDAAEQKRLFLLGDIRNPQHNYATLNSVDFLAREEALARLLDKTPTLPVGDLEKSAYADLIVRYLSINELMRIARTIPGSGPSARADLKSQYATLNLELYGGVDKRIYRSLLNQKLQYIRDSDLKNDDMRRLHDELLAMLEVTEDGEEKPYTPSEYTVHYMQTVATELFGGLLEHVPVTEEKFTAKQVAAIFQEIINHEFGASADGWQAIVTTAKAINVVASEKVIRVPDTLTPMTASKLRQIVGHEIGIHMLRAVRGEETGLLPMELGVAGYYDAEEGMGIVMEQALAGKYAPRGVDHYITAGFIDEGNSFRPAFEMKWRLSVLTRHAKGEEITPDIIEAARNTAYGAVMRIARGTDSLPWLKDLAYYNGSLLVWRYFEKHAGDELMLNLALLGKIDPTNPRHFRAALETSTM